ncbi:hypothetical protein B0H12DRAFT_793525 [Mycena haematopus]|nr:hypothetical protein B0H12DRAFT_793525 [Mycena haematopus]
MRAHIPPKDGIFPTMTILFDLCLPMLLPLLSLKHGLSSSTTRLTNAPGRLRWIGPKSGAWAITTRVIFARAQAPTSEFCLRFILNADKFIGRKNSKRSRTLARLMKDARFHSAHLEEIEGLYVPIHYGMWLMDTGDLAGKVLFSIPQWCGISWHELSHTAMRTEANRILVGRTFEALHDSGVDFGGLSGFDIFRHAIIDVTVPGLTRADLLNASFCRSVSFRRPRVARQVL